MQELNLCNIAALVAVLSGMQLMHTDSHATYSINFLNILKTLNLNMT